MKLLRYKDFLLEDVSKWKRSWVKEDSTRELGSEYQPYEILEYVTSFHDQDSYDDTDFEERVNQFEKFILKMINIDDLDLDEFQLDDSKVDEYIEDYKSENGEYPAIVVGEDLGNGYKYGIIDGLHRANAFDKMGITKIRSYVGVGTADYVNESFEYEDEYVKSRLNDDNGTLQILEWDSKNTERNGTEKTLSKFRKQYTVIHAIDCGYEHEESFKYWKHMLSKGLIDGFIDDNGEFFD